MLTHEEMIGLQAEKHELIDTHSFRSKEEYVLHLIHAFAYLQASRLAANKRVLDLGCNTGYGTEILFRSAKSVIGVDVSEKAISTAKNLYEYQGIRFNLIDGKKLPFADNEFDVVVSFQVIEHIINHQVYVSELKRVLSPKGIVIFTTPNALLRLDPGMKPWNEFHIQEFNHSELDSLLNTFFSEVRLFGLFAKESLYSIEVSRLNTARENARKRDSGSVVAVPAPSPKYSLRSLIKMMLPECILTKLKSFNNSLLNVTPTVDKSFMEEHGVEDLFYLPEGLENALDLLAICSDEKENLPESSEFAPPVMS